jgi:hypothetical protein
MLLVCQWSAVDSEQDASLTARVRAQAEHLLCGFECFLNLWSSVSPSCWNLPHGGTDRVK